MKSTISNFSQAFLLVILLFSFGKTVAQEKVPRLLLRVDDIGMNHSTNMALKQLAATGMRFSAPVMTPCPWFQEAVEILKANPQIAVGVHLTLNSEWKNYRWGPVLGNEAVPSLVAQDGYFHPSTSAFLESEYSLDEVRNELDAQIQKAISSGLNVVFVDFHMRTAVATPELEQITIELAHKYGLKRSMRMDETYKTMYNVAPEEKATQFLQYVKNELDPEKVNLIINHVAVANPEMKALVDMNNTDQHNEEIPVVANHREAELNTLLSVEFQQMIKEGKIKLVNYSDL